MMKNIIVGTAGHVDHGKSTLIKALTGTDPDRLREEKERGITIDIGFAGLDLDKDVHIGFVDVPGHEKFIKNMLAGVGGIDAVLLVVAADESVMPQTREHVAICQLLNVSKGVVAISKCDLVEPEIVELVRIEIQEYLKGTFLSSAPIVAVSGTTGLGIGELKSVLANVANSAPPKDVHTVFRLPIDRSFTLRGFGTIVTGSLTSGAIRLNDEVEIYPTGRKTRIRTIQVHGHGVELAVAGQRVALNLQGIETSEIQRGMQLSVPRRFASTKVLYATVTLLDTSPFSLRDRTRIRFHHGTSELMATLIPLGKKEIVAGRSGLARIVLEEPVLAVVGDRFVIRRASPMETIGGGRILENRPIRTKQRSVLANFLESIREQDLHTIILGHASRQGIEGIDEIAVLSRTQLQSEVVRQAINQLAEQKRLVLLNPILFEAVLPEVFEQMCHRVLDAVSEFHLKEPLSQGIPKERLFSELFRGASPACFKKVIEVLQSEVRVVLEQERVALPGHQITLNNEELTAKQQIEDAFLRAGWKAPSTDEVLAKSAVSIAQARRLIQLLIREKRLARISEDLLFHTSAIEQLKEQLAAHKKKSERIDVAQFKVLTNISRKYAIPLLEYLDRQRVTRRVGDYRLIL
jgi:selenocysteine-specific elongation factor